MSSGSNLFKRRISASTPASNTTCQRAVLPSGSYAALRLRSTRGCQPRSFRGDSRRPAPNDHRLPVAHGPRRPERDTPQPLQVHRHPMCCVLKYTRVRGVAEVHLERVGGEGID